MDALELPAGATTGAGASPIEVETIYVLHASAPVYYPAPDGATYCNQATCTHAHPDTPAGREAAEACGESLRRIIRSGRLPKWATLASPIGGPR